MHDTAASPAVTFVDEPAAIGPALATVAADVVGLDVERADADAYFRRAALVQVGVDDRCVLLDAVALDTLSGLGRFLDDGRLAVLHAADNDLAPLAAKGVRPSRLADTAVAAAVLGRPTGLAALLDEVLGVRLDDDKERFQRADWEARPLPSDMASYAAGDVVHLPALWEALAAELRTRDRLTWYEQELAWSLARADEAPRAWTRVKGSARLSGRERAILRALWEERERLARDHDLAPNRLVHDDVLRDLATDPPRTAAQLVRRGRRNRSLLRRHAEELFSALERGRDADPEPQEREGRPWDDTDRAAYDALRRARAEVAAAVGLDPGVLCPSRALAPAVVADPEDAQALCRAAGLRPWQTELLADVLWETYTQVRAERAAGPERLS